MYLFKYPCLLHKFETNGWILGVGAKLLLTKKVFEFFCNLMGHGKAMAIQKSNGNTNAKDKDTGKQDLDPKGGNPVPLRTNFLQWTKCDTKTKTNKM